MCLEIKEEIYCLRIVMKIIDSFGDEVAANIKSLEVRK